MLYQKHVTAWFYPAYHKVYLVVHVNFGAESRQCVGVCDQGILHLQDGDDNVGPILVVVIIQFSFN